MSFLIVLAALVFLMFVAYRLQRDHVRSGRCAIGVLLTDPAWCCRCSAACSWEDGRLREVVFPRVHAGRHLRQSDRTVGILQSIVSSVIRIVGRERAMLSIVVVRDPDIWRRIAVRRRLRCLSVCGRMFRQSDIPKRLIPERSR